MKESHRKVMELHRMGVDNSEIEQMVGLSNALIWQIIYKNRTAQECNEARKHHCDECGAKPGEWCLGRRGTGAPLKNGGVHANRMGKINNAKSELNRQAESVLDKIASLEADNACLARDVEEAEKSREQMRVQIGDLKDEISDKDEEISALRVIIQNLREANAEPEAAPFMPGDVVKHKTGDGEMVVTSVDREIAPGSCFRIWCEFKTEEGFGSEDFCADALKLA